MRDYFGAEDTPYTRAVSRYWWTAHAGRVLAPGIKADMVPVLVGAQGIRKTSGVLAMVPGPEHCVEITLDDVRDADQARLLRGRLIGEIAELRGLRTRDAESIKSFISRTHENWIPKYREFATTFARRLVFVGTTNVEEFLDDETGNRRWLPVHVTRRRHRRDRARPHAVVGRGARNVQGGGYRVREGRSSSRCEEHAAFEVEDPWREPISRWLDRARGPAGRRRASDLGAPNGPANPRQRASAWRSPLHDHGGTGGGARPQGGAVDARRENRAAKVLRSLGYTRMPKQKVNGVMRRPWGRSEPRPAA